MLFWLLTSTEVTGTIKTFCMSNSYGSGDDATDHMLMIVDVMGGLQ